MRQVSLLRCLFLYVYLFFVVDFQKTTCFSNSSNQPNRPPTTQQPRRTSVPRTNPLISQTGATAANDSSSMPPASHRQEENYFDDVNIPCEALQQIDCDCSDDEIDEISEKRQSIFDGNPGPSGVSSKKITTKIVESSSSDSSSFEELLEPKLMDDNWEVIEKAASNGIKILKTTPVVNQLSTSETVEAGPSSLQNKNNSVEFPLNTEVRKLTRRRSDSSLLSLRKSSSIILDTSAFDPTQKCDSEVDKLKVSCNKCGKAKSKIKREILKLTEQLKSSNKSEAEVNAKIKEFLDYLESKSQPSEMTETEGSRSTQIDENLEDARFLPIPSSSSHDEIEENIFDENEGINVYPSTNDSNYLQESSPRRFISLDDIQSM